MSPKKSEELIEDLRAWVGERGEHYGRRAEVARALGVSRGLVGDWLAIPRRATPGLDVGLKLRAFLARKLQKPDLRIEMNERVLYILAFKDEPKIKVGLSIDTYSSLRNPSASICPSSSYQPFSLRFPGYSPPGFA